MDILRRASFSRCGQYRYQLSRQWEKGDGHCVFIGLNPSTADAYTDDPTIRRCMDFTQRWGYSRMTMVNLFAFKTPHPTLLKKAEDPEGSNNRRVLRRHCASANLIVAAWGAHGTYADQAQRLAGIWADVPVHCFGLTKSGQPLHPLYQRSDAKLVPFSTRNPPTRS